MKLAFDLKTILGVVALTACYVTQNPADIQWLDEPTRSAVWSFSRFMVWMAGGGYILLPRKTQV
jgi:hypothetical protein